MMDFWIAYHVSTINFSSTMINGKNLANFPVREILKVFLFLPPFFFLHCYCCKSFISIQKNQVYVVKLTFIVPVNVPVNVPVLNYKKKMDCLKGLRHDSKKPISVVIKRHLDVAPH